MYSYIATIGRNYGRSAKPQGFDGPMSDERWSAFEADVASALLVTVEKTRETDGYMWPADTEFRIEKHTGSGTWEGIEEDSAMISVLASEPLTHLHFLRFELNAIAAKYGQDSIALTIGESELC